MPARPASLIQRLPAILTPVLAPLHTLHWVMVPIKRRRVTNPPAVTQLPKVLLLKLCRSLPTLALGATLGLSP